MQQARIIVAFVEVLEHAGEDLWLLVRKLNALGVRGSKELPLDSLAEKGRKTQDVFVRGKKTAFVSDLEGDDGGDEGAGGCQRERLYLSGANQLLTHRCA